MVDEEEQEQEEEETDAVEVCREITKAGMAHFWSLANRSPR